MVRIPYGLVDGIRSTTKLIDRYGFTSQDPARARGRRPKPVKRTCQRNPQTTLGNPIREAWARKYPWGAKAQEGLGPYGDSVT